MEEILQNKLCLVVAHEKVPKLKQAEKFSAGLVSMGAFRKLHTSKAGQGFHGSPSRLHQNAAFENCAVWDSRNDGDTYQTNIVANVTHAASA